VSTYHVAIAGVEYGEVQLASLVVSEQLGRPSSASFTLDDMDSGLAVAGWMPDPLADIRIWDTREVGNLFRGQLTNVRATVEGVRRVFAFEAESYDRLLDTTLVGTEVDYFEHFTLTFIPYEQQGPEHIADLVTREGGFWADPNASTGIALPATDDASVVAALFEHYYSGPALTWDITSHGSVDDGGPALSAEDPSTEGREYFGQTTLREALDRTASLISGYLSFWVDADLVFHWKVLRGYTWTGSVGMPTGSTRHTLVRMLPELRATDEAPYTMVQGAAGAMAGSMAMERVYSSTVDRVYVRAGTEAASGWAPRFSHTSNTGTAAYLSAPWVTNGAAGGQELAYVGAEFAPRTTFSVAATGPYLGIHAGQTLTVYNPTLGINAAQTTVVQSCRVTFAPDGQRTYDLQVGDATVRTLSVYTRTKTSRKRQVIEETANPTYFGADMGALWSVWLPDTAPKPGESQLIWAQYTDAAGAALTIAGLKLYWSLTIGDALGNTVTYTGGDVAMTSHAFYLAHPATYTGADGRAVNALTTKATATASDWCIVSVELR
jgi:hypothetical protein